MRRVVLALCLAGFLFAVPLGEARALDAGVLRGSYKFTRNGTPYDEWTFSRIDFDGTLTAGKKTYAGAFHIVKGLIGRGEYYECGSFGCLDDPGNGWFLPPVMHEFSFAVIHGTTGGQSLKGSCGGKESESYPTWPARSFRFICSISVGGSNFKPVVINGTTAGDDLLVTEQGTTFTGGYTAAAP